MKSVKSSRFSEDQAAGETTRRGTKLTPNKKNGKEKHQLYHSLDQEEDDIEEYYSEQKESILDYIDDDEYDDDDEID